jgi:2-polyprenyl-6-methoxyphenol hydroxylase-like FAD-dependent oxidoreductase
MASMKQPEVVIVGGGIAGASLAVVLARAGREVLVLEQQPEYRDRVRGEYLANWGVLEARELGLEQTFRSVGSATARFRVPYWPEDRFTAGTRATSDS